MHQQIRALRVIGKFMFKKLGFLLIICFFVIQFLTISDYGINWDEPVHYLRGQAYLRFFLTGKKDYKDLPRLKFHYPKLDGLKHEDVKNIKFENDKYFRRSIYQLDDDNKNGEYTFTYFLKYGEGHPPLNDVIASFSNYIFYQKLGILGDIESYHLFIIFTSTILLAAVYTFVVKEYGFFAGIISILSLAFYPLFLAESHFNIKDPVETTFYALSLLTFYAAVTKKSWKWMLFSAFCAGFALGTKFNILFGVFIVLPWFFVLNIKKIILLKWPFSLRFNIALFLYPLIMLGILYAFWPYIWQNPIGKLLETVHYYKDIGSTVYQPTRYLIFGGFNTYAFQWVFYTIPLVILFFSFFGIIYALKKSFKEKNKTSLFILIWFLVPIVRVSMPKTGIYGGVRQIMEFIPAMAILSGTGAKYIVELLNCYIVKAKEQFSNKAIKQLSSRRINSVLYLLILLSFLPITLKLISIHPNEGVYFNPLIGGLKGAKEKNFPDWGVTLGNTYQQGITWINKNAEPNAKVALVNGLLLNVPRIKIRGDINFHNDYYSGKKKEGEYLMELTDYSWNNTPPEKRKYLEALKTVYEVKVDGVGILKVWKNDPGHTK